MQLVIDLAASTPDQLQLRLSQLACERERLRASGGSRESLESNRLEIVHCQHELSHALIQTHLVRPPRQAA